LKAFRFGVATRFYAFDVLMCDDLRYQLLELRRTTAFFSSELVEGPRIPFSAAIQPKKSIVI
jgi:hypothetical protein